MTSLILDSAERIKRTRFSDVGDLFSYLLEKYPSDLEWEGFSSWEEMYIQNRSASLRNTEKHLDTLILSAR